MLPSASTALVRRGHTRHLLAALLFAVGCSGTGSSCGSSCGGVTTTLPDGGAFKYAGSKLDNTIQLRITEHGFGLLNADTLNQVLGGLNTSGSVATLPCISQQILSCGSSFNVTQINLLAGDSNFDAKCTTAGVAGATYTDGTPLNVKFNSVTWTLDPVNQVLKAKVFVNIKSGDYYIRTGEAHSSLDKDDNGNPAPIQADIQIDDSENLSGQTELDVDLQFTRSPDGRLLIMPTQTSLDNILHGVDITGMIHLAAQPGDATHPGGNPPPPQFGQTNGSNGCDADTTPYLTMTNASCTGLGTPRLTGSCWTVGLGASCTPGSTSEAGIGCQIFQYIEQQLESFLKTTFQTQIVGFLQQQIDNVVCVRPTDSTGAAVACDVGHPCPKDDNNQPEFCDPTYGVCLAAGQDAGTSVCEPVALALQGTMDLSSLTQTVGFPAGTKMNFYAGLGGHTATTAPVIDDGGVQLAAVSGTQPASTVVPSLCVPPTTFPPIDTSNIPAMNFDLAANQPDGGVGTYDVGISLASKMLNQASYDAFNAGVFCLQISNKTSSFVSTQLFKTFLPSLGLLTHGTDAPMAILLRPTAQPSVRVGLGTLTQNMDGTFQPNDPLVTLTLPKLNLDFYAVIDERWVRLFTLQTDVSLPLGLRTFAGSAADTLQPVLGDLSMVLTNISSSENVLLAEDPSVVTDLLGAVIQFAQPLLAGVLKPIALPALLGLQLQVKGVGGAVPVSSNIAQDGYNHLAIWAAIATCGGTGQPACSNRTVHTEARLSASDLPSSEEEIRTLHKMPAAIIEAHASGVQHGQAEFSYRIDNGLWSPWLRESRITIRNPMFYVQGHHTIEVTSRESGDDRTQDPSPAVVDFLSSYQAPSVELAQLNDGRVVTRAKSQANTTEQLRFSYRLGDGPWTGNGDARNYSASELGGSALSVKVTDERGLESIATYGGAALMAAEARASGCSTAANMPAWSLLPLCCVGLVLALRRRRGSRE